MISWFAGVTEEEQCENWAKLFDLARTAGIHFFERLRKTTHIKPSPSRLNSIRNYAVPVNMKQLERFLGLAITHNGCLTATFASPLFNAKAEKVLFLCQKPVKKPLS